MDKHKEYKRVDAHYGWEDRNRSKWTSKFCYNTIISFPWRWLHLWSRPRVLSLFINSSLNLASHWHIMFRLFRYVPNRLLLQDTHHKKLLNLKYEFGKSHFISYETDLRQLIRTTNVMQHVTFVVITFCGSTLHVSGALCTHHQECI